MGSLALFKEPIEQMPLLDSFFFCLRKEFLLRKEQTIKYQINNYIMPLHQSRALGDLTPQGNLLKFKIGLRLCGYKKYSTHIAASGRSAFKVAALVGPSDNGQDPLQDANWLTSISQEYEASMSSWAIEAFKELNTSDASPGTPKLPPQALTILFAYFEKRRKKEIHTKEERTFFSLVEPGVKTVAQLAYAKWVNKNANSVSTGDVLQITYNLKYRGEQGNYKESLNTQNVTAYQLEATQALALQNALSKELTVFFTVLDTSLKVTPKNTLNMLAKWLWKEVLSNFYTTSVVVDSASIKTVYPVERRTSLKSIGVNLTGSGPGGYRTTSSAPFVFLLGSDSVTSSRDDHTIRLHLPATYLSEGLMRPGSKTVGVVAHFEQIMARPLVCFSNGKNAFSLEPGIPQLSTLVKENSSNEQSPKLILGLTLRSAQNGGEPFYALVDSISSMGYFYANAKKPANSLAIPTPVVGAPSAPILSAPMYAFPAPQEKTQLALPAPQNGPSIQPVSLQLVNQGLENSNDSDSLALTLVPRNQKATEDLQLSTVALTQELSLLKEVVKDVQNLKNVVAGFGELQEMVRTLYLAQKPNDAKQTQAPPRSKTTGSSPEVLPTVEEEKAARKRQATSLWDLLSAEEKTHYTKNGYAREEFIKYLLNEGEYPEVPPLDGFSLATGTVDWEEFI